MSNERKEAEQQREVANKPGRDDVHEQRDATQPREGVVPKKNGVRPPTQTESDAQRADWEGMGQPQSRPAK